jgi:hypothetical protein
MRTLEGCMVIVEPMRWSETRRLSLQCATGGTGVLSWAMARAGLAMRVK